MTFVWVRISRILAEALGTLEETISVSFPLSDPYQSPKSLHCIRKNKPCIRKIILVLFWSNLNKHQCLKYYSSKFSNLSKWISIISLYILYWYYVLAACFFLSIHPHYSLISLTHIASISALNSEHTLSTNPMIPLIFLGVWYTYIILAIHWDHQFSFLFIYLRLYIWKINDQIIVGIMPQIIIDVP